MHVRKQVMSSTKKDIVSLILSESNAYSSIENIERFADGENDLSCIPIQPLYLILRDSNKDHIVNILPKLGREQRKILLDLDLWEKDRINVDMFADWLDIYHRSKDINLKYEFVSSDQFAVYLKGCFNISTFDVDDPNYPNHDNFFITDDQLLIIEYDQNFKQVNELKSLIKVLYLQLGVEKAYSYLFKIVSDNYTILEEEEYNRKKDRLRDYGILDYYDSLFLKSSFKDEKDI